MRGNFEAMIQEETDRLKGILSEMKEALGEQQIDMVELLGDATRTPIFGTQIEEVLRPSSMCRTMHSNEFMAKGAAQLASFKAGKMPQENFKLEVQFESVEPEETDISDLIQQENEWIRSDAISEFPHKIKYDLQTMKPEQLYNMYC